MYKLGFFIALSFIIHTYLWELLSLHKTKNTKLQVLVCYTHIYHLHAQAFYSKINAAQLFYFNELINIHTNVERN